MVRYKKRYLVLQLDNFNQVFHNSKFCHQVMDIRDDALIEAIKSIVEELHGDNGRATVATGLRTIYCNSATGICLLQVRAGRPHEILASSIPFLKNIRSHKVIPRTIYTGATIKNCYKRILLHQKDQLRLLTPLMKTEAEKQELEVKLMQIRKFEASKDQSDMQ